jgi:hypothetical protein
MMAENQEDIMENHETLTLKEYMYNNRMSYAMIAGMVDYSPNHIQGVMTGRFPMTRKLARALQRATKGVVKEDTVFTRNIA